MKIIIATGGTGGHVFPALKVGLELRHQGHNVFFVGSFGPWQNKITEAGFVTQQLPAKGLNCQSIFIFVSAIFLMVKSLFDSFKIIRCFHPDSVVGFGGYGAFPAVLAASLLRYPTMIHEQNVVPGRANAILAKFVRKILISFADSEQYFRSGKVILTGCPCHVDTKLVDHKAVLANFGLTAQRQTILVLGGSQGSHRINLEFFQVMISLCQTIPVQAIHICGKPDYPDLKSKYEKLGIPFALYSFLEGINDAYKVADLVVSRAGALTITEIATAGIPSILIPYPYAGGHQKENAVVLGSVKAAIIIDEKNLTAAALSAAIKEILFNTATAKEMKERLKGICFPDAIHRLAYEVTHV